MGDLHERNSNIAEDKDAVVYLFLIGVGDVEEGPVEAEDSEVHPWSLCSESLFLQGAGHKFGLK